MENDYEDAEYEFYYPNENSSLREGKRNLPCPTCKEQNKLTVEDVRRGYQCDDCANGREG